AISCGGMAFPAERAARVAVEACVKAFQGAGSSSLEEVRFVFKVPATHEAWRRAAAAALGGAEPALRSPSGRVKEKAEDLWVAAAGAQLEGDAAATELLTLAALAVEDTPEGRERLLEARVRAELV